MGELTNQNLQIGLKKGEGREKYCTGVVECWDGEVAQVKAPKLSFLLAMGGKAREPSLFWF